MIIGTGEDISVSKTGPIGSSAWALSLDEWFWLAAKWAISVFRFIKMPFFSPSFWTWLQLGASTISYFFQVLLLKIISKFLFFMASMYLALVQTGHHCYFWDFLNSHSLPFFVLSTSVFQFFDFRMVSERKLYSPFEPQTRHSLSLLWQFKDSLLARGEFIRESTPELQSSIVWSSSLWNTNALVWA